MRTIDVCIRGFMAVKMERRRERDKKIEKKRKGRREREENDTSPH